MIKLYGHPESGHAFKVKFCLDAAGIEHAYAKIDIFADRETRPAEFRRLAKFCEVPLLVDGEQALIQSNAILVYIARKYSIFGGESDAALQRCLEWLAWEANKIGMCLPQLRADQKFADSRLSEGTRQWLLQRYRHDVNVLEHELDDGRLYILGSAPSIADFSLCGYLMYAEEAEVAVPPAVNAWLDRLRILEGWRDPYVSLGANR